MKKCLIADFRYRLSHEIATYRMAVKEVEHIYGTDVTQCNKKNTTLLEVIATIKCRDYKISIHHCLTICLKTKVS